MQVLNPNGPWCVQALSERTVMRVVPYRQPIVTRVITRPAARRARITRTQTLPVASSSDIETAAGLHLVRAGI